MTNNQLTRERLEKIKAWRETYGAGSNVMLPAESAQKFSKFTKFCAGLGVAVQLVKCWLQLIRCLVLAFLMMWNGRISKTRIKTDAQQT